MAIRIDRPGQPLLRSEQQGQSGAVGRADMRPRRCFGGGLVTSFDCPKDTKVLASRGLCATGKTQRRSPQQRHRVAECAESVKQIPVVGGMVDGLMEPTVVGGRTGVVEGLSSFGCGNVLERGDFCSVGVACGEAGGSSFEHFAHGVKLADRLVVQFRNDNPPMGLQREETVGLEPAKRFAHRCAADSERGGDFVLAHAASG